MSFGSPTPVEVAVNGPDFAETRPYAAKLMDELGKIPRPARPADRPVARLSDDPSRRGPEESGNGVRHAERRGQVAGRGHLLQPFHRAEFLGRSEDRHRLSGAGGSAAPGRALAARESSRWARSPICRWFRSNSNAAGQVLVRDVATVSTGTMPGEIDRYNMKRQVSMTANIAGTDLGSHLAAGGRGVEAGGRAPARRQGRGPRADSADARHARRAGARAGAGHCRHLPPAVGQFPVVAAVAGHRLHGPRGRSPAWW